MSIKITYECDHCGSKSPSSKPDNWMSIKSGEPNGLFIENNILGRSLISMSNCAELNFCSRECFINRFFTGANKELIETKEQILLDTLDEYHDYNTFLWFQLGYTRSTGWIVHITDKQGGGKKEIVCTQSESREEACEIATIALKECFPEVRS